MRIDVNICLVNSAVEWGGGERMFLELALGFRDAGHRVTLVCRTGSALAARLPAAIDACHLHFGGDFDVATLGWLFIVLRRQRIDAVFCNRGRDCFLAGLAAVPLRVPVVRVKAMEETRRNLRNLIIYRLLLSAVVSVSHPVQAGLADLRIPSERLQVIYNGIEIVPPAIDRDAARAKFAVGSADFAVAYTGRLVREKGVDLLPEIAARLVAAAVPLRLLVAGDGPLRTALESACSSRQLDRHVAFLGFVEQPLDVLMAADAAIMPSRTEAFPVAALEALGLGVPLVACPAGGLVEIVAHENTALLAACEDPHALAAALRRLYMDPQLAVQIGARGRARARHFSRERMIEQYEHLVRQLKPNRSPLTLDDGRPL